MKKNTKKKVELYLNSENGKIIKGLKKQGIFNFLKTKFPDYELYIEIAYIQLEPFKCYNFQNYKSEKNWSKDSDFLFRVYNAFYPLCEIPFSNLYKICISRMNKTIYLDYRIYK